jgi:DNA-binding SARP family transcriptional activator
MSRLRDRTPGTLIRLHRQTAGLTQRQLAAAAQMSIGVVRDLEQGLTGRPRAATVRRLAAALGLDGRATDDLLAAVPAAARPGPPARSLDPGDRYGLRISVLGPLTATRDGVFIPLGPELQRAVLGLLALQPNTAVHRDVLIDALWGDRPPDTAVAMIQSYISRLRRLLAPAHGGGRAGQSLITSGTSYRLCLAADELDLIEFGQRAGQADTAHAAGQLDLACRLYARALNLWRAEPLADVQVLSSQPAVFGLGHHRTDVVLRYADAAFGAGVPDLVVQPLRVLHHREPLNERAAAQLMIALAGSGRQAEALCVYDQVRRRLDDQLGVYPCAELAETHAMVLRQQIIAVRAAGGAPATLRAVPAAGRHRLAGHRAAAEPAARGSVSVLARGRRHGLGREASAR